MHNFLHRRYTCKVMFFLPHSMLLCAILWQTLIVAKIPKLSTTTMQAGFQRKKFIQCIWWGGGKYPDTLTHTDIMNWNCFNTLSSFSLNRPTGTVSVCLHICAIGCSFYHGPDVSRLCSCGHLVGGWLTHSCFKLTDKNKHVPGRRWTACSESVVE